MKNIKIIKGDITKCEVDVIVNAANCSLLGGGGVDGAIHRAAGPKLLDECRTLGGAKTGEAKITQGYDLAAKYVIHTPGLVWHGGNSNEDELLANSYRNSLRLAEDHDCVSIAFPCISTGVYSFPKERAACIALREIRSFLADAKKLNEVFVVCFGHSDYEIYESLIS